MNYSIKDFIIVGIGVIIALLIMVYGYQHDRFFAEFIDDLFLARLQAALKTMNINWFN